MTENTIEVDGRHVIVRINDSTDWLLIRKDGMSAVLRDSGRLVVKNSDGNDIGYVWDLEDTARQKLIHARHEGFDVIVES